MACSGFSFVVIKKDTIFMSSELFFVFQVLRNCLYEAGALVASVGNLPFFGCVQPHSALTRNSKLFSSSHSYLREEKFTYQSFLLKLPLHATVVIYKKCFGIKNVLINSRPTKSCGSHLFSHILFCIFPLFTSASLFLLRV